jgi:hypothetical protein
MKVLALLGCIALLLILCFLFVFISVIILDDERIGREIGCWIIIFIFIIVASGFIVSPESFGYEKISTVSENAVESEEP